MEHGPLLSRILNIVKMVRNGELSMSDELLKNMQEDIEDTVSLARQLAINAELTRKKEG